MQSRRMVWFVVIAVLSLCLFGLTQFFQSIQTDEWSEETVAVQTAYQKTIMAKATKVDTFVGAQTFKIVYGEDAIGQQLIVWVGEKEIHTEYTADGLQDKDLRIQFAKREPSAKLLRILPGKLNDSYIWELFYQKKADSSNQNYYYDYLSFKDGALIDTYNLGVK
jgi:uncharacterized protein YpmB